MWTFFAPPSLRGQFLYPELGLKQTFFDPLPFYLVHVVIEQPLFSYREPLKMGDMGQNFTIFFVFVGKYI